MQDRFIFAIKNRFSEKQKSQSLISEFYPFRLGWTHYLILMRIENAEERRFYEIESVNQQWSVRQLQRQYNSSLYQRLALSRKKDEVLQLANEGQMMTKPTDILKNPLVLEFLGMEEKSVYSEKLKHQDLGQLQMYVNYFDRYVKKDFEKPTVGILLCKEKNDSVVKLTLPENSNIYASEYSLYLPDKTLLQHKFAEWVQEFKEMHGGDEE
ncbi:MAG: PDDEXK nuclease domain-containing protein [Saccharofermentanales bacterium]